MPRSSTTRGTDHDIHDVLVIGSGPGGASAAYWLAEAGWDVVVVEKKRFPREKTCGDGLTPRSVRQLYDMGIGNDIERYHRYEGLRAVAFGHTLELPWPSHSTFPSHGFVVARRDLDILVAERARKAGALVLEGVQAHEPLLVDVRAQSSSKHGDDQGPVCAGALITDTASGSVGEIRARYVVVADGANSRFGRALGTTRNRSWPMGMALRGYYRSSSHDDPWIESHLDIRDKSGTVVPGYGWIFPMGDGRVNVGAGLLSTSGRFKGVNTTHLLEQFIAQAPRRWGLSESSSCGEPTGGRLPMGLSVGPRVIKDALLVGDAGACINPFNGEGIAYAYESGRIAAATVADALTTGDRGALEHYEKELQAAYGTYFKMARAFVKAISNPAAMRVLLGTGMHSTAVMEWVMRIMANLLRADHTGPAEATYKMLEALVAKPS
ncbi:MAG: geranylgeranyl reductase family protein [Acidimicrobiales bacterium]